MHRPWAHWPQSRGWNRSRRWLRRDDAREIGLFVIDPDFDDDSDDLAVMLQRIRERGCISMHPNGDSRDPMFDPVPLFGYSREPNNDIGEYARRHPPPQYSDRRVYVEPEVIEPQRGYSYSRVIEPLPEPARPTPYEKKRLAEKAAYEAAKEEQRALQAEVERACKPPVPPPGYFRFFRPDVPIRKGDGRVWQDMVMVNEDDSAACHSKWGTELWRGDGFVIYRIGV